MNVSEACSAIEASMADEIGALKSKLPPDVVSAFEAVIDTSYDCGQHPDDDMDDYPEVYRKSLEADRALLAAILKIMGPSTGDGER